MAGDMSSVNKNKMQKIIFVLNVSVIKIVQPSFVH